MVEPGIKLVNFIKSLLLSSHTVTLNNFVVFHGTRHKQTHKMEAKN